MSPRYVRHQPDSADDVAAALISAALAAGVGLITFYVVRLLMAREPLRAGHAHSLDTPRPES